MAFNFRPSCTADQLQPQDLQSGWAALLGADCAFRPEGLGLLPNGDVVMSDSLNGRIKLFDSGGRFIRFIGHKGKSRVRGPRGIAVLRTGTIAAYDQADSSIKFYSPKGSFLLRLTDVEVQHAVPMTTSLGGDLVIPASHGIVFFTVEDAQVKHKHVIEVDTDFDLSTSRGIAVTPKYIVLCGIDGDVIVYITYDGKIHRTIAFSNVVDVQSGLKSSFFGMCTYLPDTVVIADADNNRLVVITEGNEPCLRAFDCDAWIRSAMKKYDYSQLPRVLLCPKFPAVKHNGDLWVLENLGTIKVFHVPYLTQLKNRVDLPKVANQSSSGCSERPRYTQTQNTIYVTEL